MTGAPPGTPRHPALFIELLVGNGRVRRDPAEPAGSFAYSVAFASDGAAVVHGDSNGKAYLWNARSSKASLGAFTDPQGSQGIYRVSYSPNGGILATVDFNGNIYLWNTATRNLMATIPSQGQDLLAPWRSGRMARSPSRLTAPPTCMTSPSK